MTLGASWGATAAERGRAMPCDELLPDAPVRLDRAISVHAPAEVVFRWLCQLKLAPYSYDLIDNLARRSPRRLTPGAEQLEVGQRFMWIFTLSSFAHGEHITLRSRRTAVTYAVRPADPSPAQPHDSSATLPGRSGSRLLARVLFHPPGSGLGAAVAGNGLGVGDLMMMRKQLLTLKALAERDAAARAQAGSPPTRARGGRAG